jgi:hypothetical protein
MRLTIDLETCALFIWPSANTVVFVSKWTHQTQVLTIEQMIKILENVTKMRDADS